ncbi:Uncharacterised protein [uncultured Comamonas sp.]|nr:Uncharacterised protein [uncultured Comamonas sp.]
MRAATSLPILVAGLLVSSLACAQAPATDPDSPAATGAAPANDRHNQRIERIRHEDKGSQIDELRVGGETKTITVQPKTGKLPAYEVAPAKPGKDPAQDGTNGRRTWKALQF